MFFHVFSSPIFGRHICSQYSQFALWEIEMKHQFDEYTHTHIGSTGRTVYLPYMVSCRVNIRPFVPWIRHGEKAHQVRCSRDPWRLHRLRLIEEDSLGRWWFLPGDTKTSGSGELRESQRNCKLNIATWEWISLSRIQGDMNNIFFLLHKTWLFPQMSTNKKGATTSKFFPKGSCLRVEPGINHLKGRSTNRAVSGKFSSTDLSSLPRRRGVTLDCMSFVYWMNLDEVWKKTRHSF